MTSSDRSMRLSSPKKVATSNKITKASITEAAYNPQKLSNPNQEMRTPVNTKVLRNLTPDTINTSTPQINKSAYNKLDSSKRIRILQIACESPDILNLYHNRKLFCSEKNSDSVFITKKIKSSPIKPINKNLWKVPIRSIMKSKLLENTRYSANETKEALLSFKEMDSKLETQESRFDLSPKARLTLRENSKKLMCDVIKNIVSDCESLRKSSSRGAERLDSSIDRERINARRITEHTKWTTGKLEKWSDYQGPVLRELIEQECFAKANDKRERLSLSRELANRSQYEVRDQARFIKKILKRYMERVI